MGDRLSGKRGDDGGTDRSGSKGAARMSATGRPSAPDDGGQRRRLREAKSQGGKQSGKQSGKRGGKQGGPGRPQVLVQSADVMRARRSPGGRKAGRGRTILAAGAVLWLPGREKKNGKGMRRPRIALIHRPKYDDWSLPKGKLDPGESMTQAALREVEEETGLRCVLGVELPTQHYLAQGRPKEVRYWAAVPAGGRFTPNREVDRLEWLPARKARARLTHDRDRLLVDALLAALGARPL